MRFSGYIKLFLFSSIIGLCCVCCITTLDYSNEDADSIIVVTGFAQTDSAFSCSLTHSNSVFESSWDYDLSDASAELFVDNESLGYALENDGSVYSWPNIIIDATKSYAIKVSHDNYTSVSASTEIPDKSDYEIVSFDKKTEVEYDTTYYTYGSTQGMKISTDTTISYDLQLKINDSESTDYYRLVVTTPNVVYDYDVSAYEDITASYDTTNWVSADFTSDDIIFSYNMPESEQDLYDISPNTYNLISDELFDGSSYTFTINFEEPEAIDSTSTQYKIDLQKISEDTYLYFKSIDESDYYDGSDAESYLLEPFNIYTNVNNGAGILGAVNSNIKRICIAGAVNESD